MSIQNCNRMCEFPTDGQITSTMFDSHWITGPYPKEDSFQEELRLKGKDKNMLLHSGEPAEQYDTRSPHRRREPRMLLLKLRSGRSNSAIYWFDLKLAQDKGIVFRQTLSNAIILKRIHVRRLHGQSPCDTEEGILYKTLTLARQKIPRIGAQKRFPRTRKLVSIK